MTHQDVSKRYRFENVEVVKRSEFNISRLFRNKEVNDFDAPLGAATGQLWIESAGAFDEANALTRSRPQEHCIPVRRLVIFSGQVGKKENPPKIISIIITGAIRYILEDDRPEELDPKKTRFIPNKPSEDKYISVAVIRPLINHSGSQNLPSIPLDIMSFRKEEEKDKFDCKQVELTFADEDCKFSSLNYP
jgi:hypothetical protein